MQKSICRKAAWGILERLLREATLELSLAEWIPYHQVDTIYVHILHWGEHTTDRRNSLCRGRRNHKINNSLGNSRQLSYWKDRVPSKECLEKRRRKICLGHWFSSFRMFRITQRAFENKFLDSSSSFRVGAGWGWAICMSSKFQGDVDVLVWRPHFENPWLSNLASAWTVPVQLLLEVTRDPQLPNPVNSSVSFSLTILQHLTQLIS